MWQDNNRFEAENNVQKIILDIRVLMCYNKGTVKQDKRLTYNGNTKVSIE